MKRILVALLAILMSVSAFSQLKVSSNKRFLVNSTNTPVFISGDTPWSMIANLTIADAKTYLNNRAAYGFNCVITNLIEHLYANNAPRNIYNVSPWTGAAFSTPNPAYFAVADSMIAYAQSKGIYVFLDPIYLGYQCGNQGWCAEVSAASSADMTSWGTYVGNRYKNYTNIVWLIGGDTNPSSAVKAKVETFVAALLAADPNHICTSHQAPEYNASDFWGTSTWLAINNVYTYSTTLYTNSQSAYSSSPTRPFFLIESAYENEHSSTQQQLRAEAYWAVLSGGCGEFFGNLPIWSMSSGWQSAMTTQGSVSMKYLSALFNSRNWWNLQPSNNLMTTGIGSGTSYATTELASDGSSIISYLPTSRAIVVNASGLKDATVNVYWYNPSNGTVTSVVNVPKGNLSLTPPSSGDWILVLDAPSFNFPLPGNAVAPTPILTGTFAGSPTNLPVGGGDVTLTWTSQNATSASISGIGTVALNGNTLVHVDSTKTFVLTLSDGKTTTTYSVTIVVGATFDVIYGDNALTSPWQAVKGWSTAQTYTNTTPVYSGTTSMKVVYSAWGSLQFTKGGWNAFQSIDATKYTSLNFALSGGTAAASINVACLNSSGTAILTPINVTSPANTWTLVSIPMSKLATTVFTSIEIKTPTGAAVTFYLDDVKLVNGTVTPPVVVIPNVPVLSSPLNGATGVVVTPTLTWNASTGATKYHIHVATDSLFANIITDDSTLTSTTKSLSALSQSSKYYWKVSAGNTIGWSGYSAVWSFTTQDTTTPPPVSSTDIYVDALVSPWSTVRSWSATIASNTTAPVFTGTSSLKVTASAWASVQFCKGNWSGFQLINPVGYTSFSFAIYGTKAATITVSAMNASNGNLKTPVSVSIVANTWTTVTIPISSLSTTTFTSFSFNVADTAVTFVLDNVKMIMAPAGTLNSSMEPALPVEYGVFRNYPNPFNPTTMIRYEIKRESNVKLVILDVLGREVALLVEGRIHPGIYENTFNANACATGIYFARLYTDDGITTIKLNLIK